MDPVFTQVPAPASVGLCQAARRLCSDKGFLASERLKAILVYLCERAEHDSETRVTQSEIALDVMDLGTDFDPSADAHVRIEVRRLRRELDLFYGTRPKGVSQRIEIPKGAYRPVLRPMPGVQRIRRRNPPRDRPTVAIADLGAVGGASAELADLITAEARLICHGAPLVRSGAMSIASIAAGSEAECDSAARDLGAQFALCGRIHSRDGEERIHLALLDTRSGVTVWRAAHSLRTALGSNADHVPTIAGEMATIVADPIAGVAPARLAAAHPETDLSALFAAYDYIASQDGHRVKRALAGLVSLNDAGRATATSHALLADMLRVAANMRMLERHSTAERGYDLTEQALQLDPKNPAAQLARGYALLSLGEAPETVDFGEGTMKSLRADANLLSALTENREYDRCPTGLVDLDFSDQCFMDEFATIIRLIKSGDFEMASSLLDCSTNTDIYWLHLFRVAVFGRLGNRDASRRSARTLRSEFPGIVRIADSVVGGFFPDPELRSLFRDGLGQSA